MKYTMDTINQKDASQDQEIALLKHRIEDNEKMMEELRDRVRKLEKWVWGAAAVITAAITLIGFAVAVEAKEGDTLGIMLEEMRRYEREKTQTDPNVLLDNALRSGTSNGSNDATKSEELLQLPSDRDNESS